MRFKHYLNESNVLVYDTLYGNPEDVLFALDHLKPKGEEKIIILISHLGVWSKSGLKEKRVIEKTEPVDGDQAGVDNTDNPDGQPGNNSQGDKEPIAKPKLGGFDDDDSDDNNKKKDAEPKDDVKPPEPVVETEPEEPKPPVYVPWMETDFKERVPLEE